MALDQKLHLRLSQKLIMTPSLQQAIKLLQMSKLELQAVINSEMVENPILEEEDEIQEDTQIEASAEAEPVAAADEPAVDSFQEIDYESYFQDYLDAGYNPRSYADREDFPFENVLSKTPDLYDHLIWQLNLSAADPRIKEIGQFIIGNLTRDGYLEVGVEELAGLGNFGQEDLLAALTVVQGLDPAGVGARDLKECLLLQLEALEIDDPPLVSVILEHWDLFTARQFPQLAKALDIPMPELEAIVGVIKHLDPRPGQKYSSERAVYVEPDVHVQKVGEEYVIMLNEDGMPKLRISHTYRKMLGGLNGQNDAANYIKDKMRSAIWLMKSLDQRQRTIYKVTDSIVKHQREFFDKGIEYLKPMVLRDVAEDIQMHESTISRVVSNKYMNTPRGLFPMKYFFHSGIDSAYGADVSSLSVKRKIKTLIDDEDSNKPLSDSKIMKSLNRDGLNIARRTVAKYRDELRIPSSTDRKRVF